MIIFSKDGKLLDTSKRIDKLTNIEADTLIAYFISCIKIADCNRFFSSTYYNTKKRLKKIYNLFPNLAIKYDFAKIK